MDSYNRSFRYLRRFSPFSPFRNRYRWTLSVLFLFCFTLIVITKLAKSDTTITIAHFDTKIYNQQILNSDDLIVANSKGILDSDVRNTKRGTSFSYVQSEGYNNNIFDCNKLKAMKVKQVVASGFNSIMYSTLAESGAGKGLPSIRIVSKKSPEVSACLLQSTTKDLKIDCSVISDQILSHEVDVLNKFRHPNVAPVLNMCQRVDGDRYNAPLSRVGTKLMILEEAKPLDMSERLQLDWRHRVKTCIDIGELIVLLKLDLFEQRRPRFTSLYVE